MTERILDVLKQRNLPATFFMIGQHVAAAPELARRVLAEGHEIGNHSLTHPKLAELPESRVVEEIQKTQAIMREILVPCALRFFSPQSNGHFATGKSRACFWQCESVRLVSIR